MPEGIPEQPGALQRIERRLESQESVHAELRATEVAAESRFAPAQAAPAALPRATVIEKSPLREDIEGALADDRLRTIYATLAPRVQAVFRAAAEQLAARIEQMLTVGKFDLTAVHDGIVQWLRVIPAANRWFLLQETKVKTDAVVALAQRPRTETLSN